MFSRQLGSTRTYNGRSPFVVTARAPSLPGQPWQIVVTRPDIGWQAVASFPYEMREEAYDRLRDLRTDKDIVALLREWGDDEEKLQEFIAYAGDL